jgi:hypothetical protein
MAVKIIVGWDDPEFDTYKDMFYNFTPDDWDYMIIGDKEHEVEWIAEKLYVCDFQIKQIGDRWVAVTYHS